MPQEPSDGGTHEALLVGLWRDFHGALQLNPDVTGCLLGILMTSYNCLLQSPCNWLVVHTDSYLIYIYKQQITSFFHCSIEQKKPALSESARRDPLRGSMGFWYSMGWKKILQNIPPFERILRVNSILKIPEMHMIDGFKQIADMSFLRFFCNSTSWSWYT